MTHCRSYLSFAAMSGAAWLKEILKFRGEDHQINGGKQTNTGINFQHGYLNRPYSELFLSNNGRNQRWSKCMTILIYELWFCHKSDNKMHSFNWVKWQRDHILLCDPIQQLILKASNEQSWFHDRPKGEVHSSKEQYWIYWDAPTQDASSK